MAKKVLNHSIIVAVKDQVYCDLAGEVAILNLKNGIYYGLDPVGAKIWDLIQKPKTVNEIKAAILEKYDVEPDRCKADILILLQELSDNELIEVKDDNDP